MHCEVCGAALFLNDASMTDRYEHRIRTTPPRNLTGSPSPASTSTAELNPDFRPIAEGMLRDAQRAEFVFRVTETYRSPLREAS